MTIYSTSFSGQAVFDDTETYRYLLLRPGDGGKLIVVWVMLNPSTATAAKDDPTVRRTRGFAKLWGQQAGAGGCAENRVTNAFALRSTDPKALAAAVKAGRDPIGPDNDTWIRQAIEGADIVVCAWGAHGALLDRDLAVLDLIRSAGKTPMALGFTKGKPGQRQQPVHPLYQPADRVLIPWPATAQAP